MVLMSNLKISVIYPYIFVLQIPSKWNHQNYQPSVSKVNYISFFESFMWFYLVNSKIHRFINNWILLDLSHILSAPLRDLHSDAPDLEWILFTRVCFDYYQGSC
jgi:hypothetical protein